MEMHYSRELPVAGTWDVLVCGAGPTGIAAAVTAARQGYGVLLLERYGAVGGNLTLGNVSPVMGGVAPGTFAEEVDRLLEAPDGATGIDPERAKIELTQLLHREGVTFRLQTPVFDVLKDGGAVIGVVASTQQGPTAFLGRRVIDCTGDGDVSVLAGAQYTKGNPETGKNQPISLRYIVSGVDIPALGEFFKSEIERTGIARDCSYTPPLSVYAACCGDGATLSDVFKRAIAAGDLTVEDHLYWQMFNIPDRNDSIAFNNSEFFENLDGTNPDTLTKTQVAGKKAIYRQLAFYKKYMKGFENAYIADIAAMVGIRESRNITTEYVLTGADLLSRKKFDDAFCQSNYPVDIHGYTLEFVSRFKPAEDARPYYEIPYGSLVVKGFENLLVAGRCLGAEFLAQSSLRIQPCCRSAGEAAGIAAALALDAKIPAREVDGRKVRKIMEDRGAVYAAV